MDFLFTVPLLLLIGLLLFRIFGPNQKEEHIVVSGHGHRCYTEGLNESEKRIVNILAKGLDHKDYFIFNNLVLPSQHSTSVQIDHVVVSKFGIFVIETKETSAWIIANKKSKQWAYTYPPRGQKHFLQNPLQQNYGHIMSLTSLMPFVEGHFHNLVVFTGNGEFKTERIPNVLYERELVDEILKHRKSLISPQRLLMAIGKLSFLCQTADISGEQHIENIQRLINSRGRGGSGSQQLQTAS